MMMMMSVSPASGSFQFLQAKGNSWDGGKLKQTMTDRFSKLDKDGDGQISAQETIASGGLFGQGNFALNTQTPNAAAIWKQVAGENSKISLRELTALALYIDSQKSQAMDGVLTANESNIAIADLGKAPIEADLHGVIDVAGKQFGLDAFVPDVEGEQNKIDSNRNLSFEQDKAKTNQLLEQSDVAKQLIQTIIQQLLNGHPPTTPNLNNAQQPMNGSPIATV